MDQEKAIEIFTTFAGKVPSMMALMWEPATDSYSVNIIEDQLDAVSLSVLFTTSQQHEVGLELVDRRLVFR